MDLSPLKNLSMHFALLILLLNNYETVAYHDDTHRVAKRLDVDVCSERFDIHSSTIIRTEESKAMGAKFLNDDDVASAAACMKLCCETNECDVFIYEEKTSGSCFLFHCGLPDDFRCKFTSHNNYTSGVLTVPRQDLEASTTQYAVALKPKLTQNELELVNLKRPSNAYHLSAETIPSPTSTIPPLGVRLADVTSTKTTAPTKSSCGRFQYQCQTSKECIAVYNVCDQIAQCEDGSDEGPECAVLNFGQFATTKTIAGVESQLKLDGQVNKNRVMPVNINDNFNQMPRPLHNREDPLSAPKYPQSHVTQYTDTDTESRIFNHKNSLLSGNNFPPPQQYPKQFQRDPYMMPQQSMQPAVDESMYREQPQISRSDWNQQQQPLAVQPKQGEAVWPEKLSKSSPVSAEKASRKKIPNRDSDYSEEYAEVEESQAEGDDVTTTETPKKKQRKHKKVKNQKDKQQKNHEKPLHEQLKQLKSSNDVEARFISEHSGHVEKPTGAVLSLTLGSLVLAALSVLIGCRLRKVNVRRRRGKSVEADYLVNGLYL